MGQDETSVEKLYIWNKSQKEWFIKYIYITPKLTIQILYDNKTKKIFNYSIDIKYHEHWTRITDIKEINLFKMKYL